MSEVLVYPDAFDFWVFPFQVKTCARLSLSIVFDCLFSDIIFKLFEKLINLVGYEAATLFSFSNFFVFVFLIFITEKL